LTKQAYNAARWLRVLALPSLVADLPRQAAAVGAAQHPRPRRALGPAAVLRLPAAYQHVAVFIAALERIRALPAFA
jgi:hypothetical protein